MCSQFINWGSKLLFLNDPSLKEIVLKRIFTAVLMLSTFGLCGCSKRSDSVLVLSTLSAMGSTVVVASFDGNSAFKGSDCEDIAKLLSEKYGRKYQCAPWAAVKNLVDEE